MDTLAKDKDVRVQDALDKVLNVLGGFGKQATLYELESRYRIWVNGDTSVSMEQVEFALKELFGSASELIIKELEKELERAS